MVKDLASAVLIS